MPKFYESVRKEVQTIDDEVSTIAQDINSLSSAVNTVDNQLSTIDQNQGVLSSAIAAVDNEVSTLDDQISTVLQRQNTLSTAIDAVSTPITDITKGCSLALATAALSATVPLTTITKGCSLAIATAGLASAAAVQTIDNEISTIDDQLSTVLQRQNVLSSAIDAVSTPITDITKGCSLAIATAAITATTPASTITKGCSLAIATAGVIQTIDDEVSTIKDAVDGLSTAIQRKPVSKDWWSAIVAVVTITGTTTAKALPEVTIPGSGGNRLPAGVTIQGAIPMVKFRKLQNTNATNANALSGIQHLQVRDDGGGNWHNFLTLPDGLLDIATATVEGGDLWIANIDLSSTGFVDGADTYEFQISHAHAEQDNLELRGIQSGIRVYYY